MSNTTTTYSTLDDAHAAVVEALGEYAAEYDTEAIANEVFEWVQETRTDADGNVWLKSEGYREKEKYADEYDHTPFWDMIENYALDTQDEGKEEAAPQLQNPFLDMMNAPILPDQK